jgi:hypothetical protein
MGTSNETEILLFSFFSPLNSFLSYALMRMFVDVKEIFAIISAIAFCSREKFNFFRVINFLFFFHGRLSFAVCLISESTKPFAVDFIHFADVSSQLESLNKYQVTLTG